MNDHQYRDFLFFLFCFSVLSFCRLSWRLNETEGGGEKRRKPRVTDKGRDFQPLFSLSQIFDCTLPVAVLFPFLLVATKDRDFQLFFHPSLVAAKDRAFQSGCFLPLVRWEPNKGLSTHSSNLPLFSFCYGSAFKVVRLLTKIKEFVTPEERDRGKGEKGALPVTRLGGGRGGAKKQCKTPEAAAAAAAAAAATATATATAQMPPSLLDVAV